MRILFFGDIVGKNGRNAIKRNLGLLKSKFRADLVIANGENATHGKGLIENHYNELIEAGIDIITLGNHYLSKSEITEYIQHANRLVRPLNIKSDIGGYGSVVIDIDDISIRVTNVLGQVFLHEEVENPFDSLDQLINNSEKANIHIVDFHAEATGEKQALAWAFDGKVSAVLGTHTHVQTNDNRQKKDLFQQNYPNEASLQLLILFFPLILPQLPYAHYFHQGNSRKYIFQEQFLFY